MSDFDAQEKRYNEKLIKKYLSFLKENMILKS